MDRQYKSRAVLIALVCVLASGAQAQSFRATLGDRVLGSLTYKAGSTQSLKTLLNNTPLGVGDGTFEGVTRAARTTDGRTVIQYVGTTRSSRKERQISVLLDKGNAIQTDVSPRSERTPLSDPTAVPGTVIDPVTALGRLINAPECPASFRMYDGRRAIQVSLSGSETSSEVRKCHMSYDVIAGPGHLSPFGFKALKLELTYDNSGLVAMDIRTGPFKLQLQR